jgi:hypothetical protein
MNAIKQVSAIYTRRGFRITMGHTDNEFEPMRGDFLDLGMELNAVSNDEHVPEIQRYIRTVKERTRCVYTMLPYKKMPSRMIVEMFPANNGVSDTMSPREIVAGLQIDFHKHCELEFGEYVQTHEEHDNTMATRTTGAIALRPTGNAQGATIFLASQLVDD